MKTLRTLFKQDKEAFVVPKGIQDVIPVTRIWQDGIFQVGKNKYSKCYRFTDINYAVASRSDKEGMFLEYSELLNSFDTGATTKITILNRRLNRIDFEKNILLPLSDDDLDEFRKEYNKMLLDKATGANGITQEKFLTVSVNKKSIEEARNYFTRISADLINHFSQLGSKCIELEAEDRLRLCHDFYRQGEENSFTFDMIQNMKKGHSFKDFICPDSFKFEKDYFKMGKKYEDRLIKSYSFDGPGFKDGIKQFDSYPRIKHKLVKYITYNDFVGMVFNNHESPFVVYSTGVLLGGHDPFYWKISAE